MKILEFDKLHYSLESRSYTLINRANERRYPSGSRMWKYLSPQEASVGSFSNDIKLEMI
jgi:hypothetical protein